MASLLSTLLIWLRIPCIPIYHTIQTYSLKIGKAILYNTSIWSNWIASLINPWYDKKVDFNEITMIGDVSPKFTVSRDYGIIKDIAPFYQERLVEDILFYGALGTVFVGIYIALRLYYKPEGVSVYEGLTDACVDLVDSTLSLIVGLIIK